MTKKLSIIGTAGRDKGIKLTSYHYDFMYNKVLSFIKENKLDDNDTKLTLVSGGAAFSDHIAVRLFLNNPNKFNLILYLPCLIDKVQNSDDDDDGSISSYKYHEDENDIENPGKSLNKYHELFKNSINSKSSTINDIIKAGELGAILDFTNRGFHNRNLKIGQSDYIIAFTTSKSGKPESGGTLDTWNNSNSLKYHFTIPFDT